MAKKPSRLIVYTVVGGLAVYAYLMLSEPDAPTTTHKRVTSSSNLAADASGITPEDLKASFPRYSGKGHDPFAPAVAVAKPQSLTTLAGQTRKLAASAGVTAGEWTLTGVNKINGTASALVENSTTNDTVFLHPGDVWNGLKVLSIEGDAVDFVNIIGKPVRLAFSNPAVASGDATLPKGTVLSIAAAPPSVSAIQPLPPMPTAPAVLPSPEQLQPDQSFQQPIIINAPSQPNSDNGNGQPQQPGPPQGPPPGPPPGQ